MRLLICLFLCLLLAVGFWLTASAAFSGALRGDADGDGRISSLDVTVIQRVLTDVCTDDTGDIAKRGDVNEDGLSLPDASAIQRYLAGFRNDYHIGERISPITFPTEDNQLPIL